MKYKHFIILSILFLFTCLPSFSKEYTNLYLIKNIQKENLDNFAQGYFLQNNYEYKEKNGYLVQFPNTDIEHRIIIKQNSQDCYFYILSNTKEDKLTIKILKQIKNSGLKTKKIKNDELKELFYNDAKIIVPNDNNQESISDIYTIYDFSDEAQAKFEAKENKYSGLKPNKRNKIISENKNIKENWQEDIFIPPSEIEGIAPIDEITSDTNIPFSSLKGQIIQIPKGETINAVLQSSINSQSVNTNDIITAVLNQDWIYKNNLIAPAGSILYGQVIDAQKAGYAYGNGEIEITFTEMLTMDGQKFNLAANKVKLSSEINRGVKIASQALTGAILGVASGVMYALITGGDVSRGLAIGAGVGGAGGLVRSGLQKGEDIEIPSGTNLQIKFLEAMNFAPAY